MFKISDKYKLIIIITVVIAILFSLSFGSLFYFKIRSGNLSKSDVFTLLDKKVILTEDKELTPETRKLYEDRANEAQANLAKRGLPAPAGDKDFFVANYGNLALYKSYLGEYSQSYELYLKTLELESKSRVIWMAFGDLLVRMKAYLSAEAAYKKALALNQYEPEGYIKLADLYRLTGAPESKIEEVYKKGLENIVDNTLLLSEYAKRLSENGDNNRAIEIYEKLKELQPQNREALDREINKLKK